MVAARRDLEALSQTVPIKVREFLEEFEEIDEIQRKARLQVILKTAHVWSDGRVDFKFR